MKERWKIVTYPSVYPNMYEISDCGRIRNFNTSQILSQYTLPCGYKIIKCKCINPLTKNIVFKNQYIHKLVAWAFCPLPDKLEVVDHLDSNKANNHYSNLEWVTHGENTRRAIKNGLVPIFGEDNASNVYSEELVRFICNLLELGYSKKDILTQITGDDNSTCRKYSKLYALIVHLHMKDRFTNVCNEYSYEPIMKNYSNDPIANYILEGYENIDIMKLYGYKCVNDNTALYSRILETKNRVNNVQRLSKT